MAFRPSAEIKIILRAIDQATAQMRKVRGEGQALGSSFGTLGSIAKIAGGMIVADLCMRAGDAIARFVRESVSAFGEFESTLNKVVASSGETGLAAEKLRDDIREAALAAGREFGVGATQATAAMEALVKAGMKGDQAITALKATLMMATIEEMNTAEAAKYVVQSLGMFGKGADDATEMVDILTNASIKGVDTVREYAIGLGYCGKTMHTYGMSAEEAAAALVALNNQGIQAEKAGRYLDAMFRDLIEHSDKLGFEIYDAAGNMVSMDEILRRLITKMGEFETAQERNAYLAEAFGTQSRRAVLALVDMTYEGKKGAEAFKLLAKAMGESGSSAMYFARMADTQEMALKRMDAALEEARIELGAALSPAIQAFAQFVVDHVVPAIKELSDDIDNLVWLFGKLEESIRPVTDALEPLNTALGGASAGAFDLWSVLSMLGGPAGANLMAFRTSMRLTEQLRDQEAQEKLAAVATGELTLSAEELWEVIKRVAEATGQDTAEIEEYIQAQREAAGITALTTEDLLEQEKAYHETLGALRTTTSQYQDYQAELADVALQHDRFLDRLGLTEEEFDDLASRVGMTTDELTEFAKETGATAEELQSFAGQMDTIKSSFFDVFTEESQEFQSELEDVGQSVYTVLSGMEPDFASAHLLIQEFADRWGITWEEAEALVSSKVSEIKETIGEIPKTLEEELIGKAQRAMDEFKKCMGEKSTATKEETEQAMKDMVDVTNELIASGLLGEAQALMDEFKEHEPDKMLDMSREITGIIEGMKEDINTEYEAMLAYADQFSGEERDMLIERAKEWREGKMAELEQFEEWQAMLHTRMLLETEGFTTEEQNIIMSALLEIKSQSGATWSDIEGDWQNWMDDILSDTRRFTDEEQREIISTLVELKTTSGAKWSEITQVWENALNDAEGDVNSAINTIQNKINSLQGKTVYVKTVYQTEYQTLKGLEIGYTSGGGGTTTTPTPSPTYYPAPSYYSPTCFLAGTKVLMGDGSEKDIEDVKPGDLVKSWNLVKFKAEKSVVLACFRGEANGFFILNDRVMVTGEHPFFTHTGWKRAKNLRNGDLLFRGRLGFSERLTRILYVEKKVKIYNFCVVPWHNYFADGVLVHNKVAMQMGIEEVPAPGLLAWLHPREAVLRADQAARWRQGRGRGGDVYVFNLPHAVISSDIGIRETAARLAKYEAQERRRRGLGT